MGRLGYLNIKDMLLGHLQQVALKQYFLGCLLQMEKYCKAWRVSSLKSQSFCPNSNVAVTDWLTTKDRYRTARAATNTEHQYTMDGLAY